MWTLIRTICLASLMVSLSMAQTLIPDYQKSDFKRQFQQELLSLAEALSFLEKIYQVNFAYELDILKNRKCPPFSPDISGDFYTDLQHILGNYPIQYIKIGKTTIALMPKAFGQKRALRGRISDTDGNGVAAVEIFIENTTWGTVSDNNGNYLIPNIPEGKYSLTVMHVGYRTLYREISVRGDRTNNQDFVLSPDVLNMNEIVTIAARNPLKKIESSVAITTAKAGQIAERAPRSTADIFKIIPGFYVESSGGESGNNLFPRGIPQDGSYRYVAIYEDGLPIYEAPELVFANIDIMMRLDETIAAMEGMRGGTASIYASNAPGGIINFISKTGGEEFGGLVKISIADYGYKRFDYNTGGPLGKNWQFNIGGFFRYDNGIRSPQFVANKGGQIKANITRFFKNGYMRLYGKYLNDRNIFFLPIPLQDPDDPRGISGINANYGTLTSIHQDNIVMPTPDGQLLERNISDGIHPEMISFTNELAMDLGNNWSVRNTSRFMKSDITFNAIFSLENPIPAKTFSDSLKSGNALPGFHRWEYRYSDSRQPIENIDVLNGNGLVSRNGWWSVQKPLKNFTNYFQLKKRLFNHKLDASAYFSNYSAGDFWYWHNVLTEVKDAPRMLDLVAIDQAGNDIQQITHNGFEQYGTFYVNAHNEAYVMALALVDEWEVYEKLRLDAGLRYEQALFEGRVENTADDFTVGNAGTPAETGVVFGNNTYRTYRHQFDEWAFSLGANYTFTKHIAMYARLGRGFRMPDFEQWTFSADRGKSQYVQQSEGGLKLSLANFALFGTAFFSRLDNIPFDDEIYVNNKIIKQTRFANSSTIGMEIEAIWSVTHNFRINLIGTLQSPRFRDFTFRTVDAATAQENTLNLSGNQVRRIPGLFVDIRPSYQLGKMKVYSNWQHIGARFVDDANTVTLPAYSIVNAGMAYRLFDDNITLSANVVNISNTVGLTEGNPRVEQVVANRNEEMFMARPVLGRTFMLAATYAF